MFFSDHPNKFIIQTAVEMGIDNAKTSRNINQEEIKAEYEKAKKALEKGGESEEITLLYTKFIAMYEEKLKTSSQATATLKDELKWKHLGDLREAVKSGGQGLTLADIEGINQFALAEHGRLRAREMHSSLTAGDEETKKILSGWFGMYEALKQKSIESMKVPFKDALRTAFLAATTVPFTFRYSEGNNILELSVTFKDNKIVIGSKEHALVGEKIKVGSISMDKDKLYIPFTIDGKDATYSDPIKKQEFLDKYLQDILDGKDIRIQGHLVHVSRTGELSPRVLVEGPAVPRTQTETQKENPSLDEAIKKGFMSLVSGKKSEPLTVLQDGKKYRFPVEIDQNSFTLGGRKFDFTFPSDVRRGSFEFDADKIVFFGIPRGENHVKKLFEVNKSDVAKQLSGSTNEIVFVFDDIGKIIARGSGEYLPSSSVINTPSPTAPVQREGLKYELKVYEGYAKEQLAKFGKDIAALKSALKAKKFYNGDINGTFDQATLDAVIAFQKTIKNAKYGADGLVGAEETIPALFGIPAQPNNPSPAPPVAPAPGAPGAPPVAPLPPPVPGTRPGSGGAPGAPPAVPAGPTGGPRSQEVIAEELLLKKLREKAEAFRGVYKAVSEKSGVIFDTPAEIEQYKKAINEALLPLQQVLTEFEGRKLSKEARELYDWAVLDVARYFSDGYSNIKNRHYRNYDLSVDLALSVIKEDLARLKITPPRKPDTEEVLRALATHNPKLQKKIQDDLRAGFQLGQILANPRVRSEFDAVYNTVYADYERGLQAVITKLRDNNTTFANPSGYKALDMLIFTMGTTDTFTVEWKARNRDIFWQSIGMIGSTAAGIAAFAATPATGGAGAILGGAILGGVVSTAGMIATKGRAGNDRETWTELGINTVTFGVGGALAKGANILMKNGTALARLSGITLDATGGVALGVSADYARAWEQNTNISLPETVRNNLAWALLPMLLGMKGVLRDRAVVLDKNMQRARAQAVTGDIEGANQTIKVVEREAADLAHDVKAVVPTEPVPKNAPAPAAAVAPSPKAAPAAKPAPKPTEAPVSYDVGNGYVLEARPDNKFIVLKDGNPQGSIPKTLAEIEWDLATAHNTIIPEGVKAQIAARPAVAPAPAAEPVAPPAAPAQSPKPAPEPTPKPVEPPPEAAPARATADDHAAPAPAPKRKPAAAHDEVHLTGPEAHAVSEEAAKTVNQHLAKFTDNKAVKLAWDLATKEIQPGGLIKSVLVFPANIMRLPAINGRKILEQWFKKSEKGFGFTSGEALDKIGNSLKIAATSSSKPFEGKTQSMLTLATMGTVAYMTYQEIQRANPNSPVELTWGAAVKFLKNMNFAFPLEFYRWFTTKIQSETAGAEVPRQAPVAIPAPLPNPPPAPPEQGQQQTGELPPSTVVPGETRTDPISDTTTQ